MFDPIKLYMDDMRKCPEGWTLARSVDAAIALLKTGTVSIASLDHDMGIFSSEGGNGTRVTDWMAENNSWPEDGVFVHSDNPVGRKAMETTILNYGGYPDFYLGKKSPVDNQPYV